MAKARGVGAGKKQTPAEFAAQLEKNRAAPLVAAATVPKPPRGYRPTDGGLRIARLRGLGAELRAEAGDALREAAKRGKKMGDDFGKYAPSPATGAELAARLAATTALVATAEALAAYAREVDQIAANDAVLYLEALRKQVLHAMDLEPGLAQTYATLLAFFDARTAQVALGVARKRKSAQTPAS